MKVLVMFGSKSDANIYEPLKARLLSERHEVDFRMISVHRSPELLDRELSTCNPQVVVAGAGLAAHLPGILASKLLVPVIGIPCAAAVGGVDAYFSISQMPFGIPVLCTAPDAYNSAVDAISRWSRLDLKYDFSGFQLVLDRQKRNLPHIQQLIQRAEKIAEKTKLDLVVADRTKENAINICLVDIAEADPECPLTLPPVAANSDEVRIFVPVLNERSYRDSFASLHVARRVSSVSNGIWVGINNVGNAMLATLQFANVDGDHNAFLTNAKKGYIHA